MEKGARSGKLQYEAYDPPKPTPKLRESVLRRALSPTRHSMGVLVQEEHPMVDLRARRESGEVGRSRSRESSSSRTRKSDAVTKTLLEDDIELSPLNLSSRTVSNQFVVNVKRSIMFQRIGQSPGLDLARITIHFRRKYK